MVVTDAELAGRADHAVGDVAVGLAGADGEAAGQHRAGQRDDDEVADGEVVRAADDAARLRFADVDLTPADGLAVLLRLVVQVEDPADDERTGDPVARGLDALDLEPDARSARRPALAVASPGGQVDVLGQPAHRRAHQASIPNAAVNRTSPSTMSRMSSTSLRNISVRSMPMPNAKPL